MIGDCLMNVLNKCSIYLLKVVVNVSAALLNSNRYNYVLSCFAVTQMKAVLNCLLRMHLFRYDLLVSNFSDFMVGNDNSGTLPAACENFCNSRSVMPLKHHISHTFTLNCLYSVNYHILRETINSSSRVLSE